MAIAAGEGIAVVNGENRAEGDSFNVTITFSEDIGTTFTHSDITASNADSITAADLTTDTAGLVFTLTVRPTAGFSGDLTLQVGAGVATDASSKANAQSNLFTAAVTVKSACINGGAVTPPPSWSASSPSPRRARAPLVTGDRAPSVKENSSSMVASYTATDPERDTLTWSVSGNDFWISDGGDLYFRSPPDYETQTNYTVTITATDDATTPLSRTLSVTVTVTDAEEVGTITINPLRGWDGTPFRDELYDDDGGIITGTWQWQWQRSSNRSSWEDISGAISDSYSAGADDVGQYLRLHVTYEDRRGSGKEAFATVTGRIEDSTDRPSANNAPAFTEDDDDTDTGRTTTRSVSEGTSAGRNVGAPVRAADEDTGDVLTYSLNGTDAGLFDINPATGQILTRAVLDYDPDGTTSYSVQVRVHDGYGPDYQSPDVEVDATIEVTIAVTAAPTTGGFVGGGVGGGGGGGGGGPSGPTASEVEFEWNVKRDIEALDSSHDSPTGAWSNGSILWLLENGAGADDGVYAYDLKTGERVEDLEFDLDETNRAPRGVWSDTNVVWVSDSGQNKLFAHDLETGERLPERDIALAPRNRDARGIWSDETTMWVLDRGEDSLFGYDLETGELLAECALDAANNDPRGIWSDGVTVWVSDDIAKRLFAYRLPVRSGEAGRRTRRTRATRNSSASATRSSPRSCRRPATTARAASGPTAT